MSTTLAALRTEGQELADEAGSTFVENTQWAIWINQGARQLARVVYRCNSQLLLARSSFSITSGNAAPGTNLGALPANALGVYAVQKDPTLTSRRWVRPVSPLMKNLRCNGLGHWRDGANVYVEPAEQSAGNYELWYLSGVATLTDVVNLPDALDPWWEYAAIFAAARAVEKDKLDASNLRKRLETMEADEIAPQALAANGILSAPIVDVEEIYAGNGWRDA